MYAFLLSLTLFLQHCVVKNHFPLCSCLIVPAASSPMYENIMADSTADPGGLSEVFAFTVLMPWTFLGVSSSVDGKFFSRLSQRMDLQSLGEGLLSLARERLFSLAMVDEASH